MNPSIPACMPLTARSSQVYDCVFASQTLQNYFSQYILNFSFCLDDSTPVATTGRKDSGNKIVNKRNLCALTKNRTGFIQLSLNHSVFNALVGHNRAVKKL
ncbi:hypothetical protein ILYODFUR_037365 [Ilyodon furcidens]|uniref:Uncharacterized protein n=1 Tax=Ilyodon furcidens TaxID=33524 RepID=A0ABV0SSD1_9TELE